MKTIANPLFEAFKRGADPCRAAYPALAGRQGSDTSGPCSKGHAGFGQVKDYSAQAPAFLLDLTETRRKTKQYGNEFNA